MLLFLQFLNNSLIVTQVLFLSPTPTKKTNKTSPTNKQKTNKQTNENKKIKIKPTQTTMPVKFFPLPTARPGSQLTVWTSSLPWWRTTQFGSFWDVPLGSRGIIWNFRKSVSLISTFSGQISSMSGTLSWSKSSLQASPRPSPVG